METIKSCFENKLMFLILRFPDVEAVNKTKLPLITIPEKPFSRET